MAPASLTTEWIAGRANGTSGESFTFFSVGQRNQAEVTPGAARTGPPGRHHRQADGDGQLP